MSPIETQKNLSETNTEQVSENSDSDVSRLVPIAESIRYRKRAQGAEKQVEDLTEQLTEAKSQVTKLSEQLIDIQAEQKLTRKLVVAGTVDMEAAVLIAKARMQGQTEADLEACVEQLKKEKQYLFGGAADTTVTKRTAGVKERVAHSQTVLERAAKRAATTGDRTDLQEYLKLRRNFA
jgi:hypothetical protein